jgi:ribosomal protein S27E
MIDMIEKITHNRNNEVASFLIITCPVCGFTFRIVDMKTRKSKNECLMCGSRLFKSDFSRTNI